MRDTPFQPSHPDFKALLDDYPDLDLLSHDFYAKDGLLRIAAEHHRPALARLMAWQRLLRVVPQQGLEGTDGDSVVELLAASGYESAQSIARRPLHRFLREMGVALGEPLATEIHQRARQTRAAVRHLFANARDVAGSALTSQALPRFADKELVDYLQGLPSYQSLFGSLDYFQVPPNVSIFSPAAYFLDIMRISDEYITDYNRHTIPPGYHLETRRPDLFDGIRLSGEETEQPVPYVSLVLQIFVARLALDLKRSPYPVVATAAYPFNLPFSAPLTDIAASLQRLDTSLSAIGQSLLAEMPQALGYATPELARAALGWSPELGAELCTVNADDAAIGAQYGLPGIAATLPAPGPGTLTFLKDDTVATGADGKLGDLLKVGQFLACDGQLRVVVERIDAASIRVDLPWVADALNRPWTSYGFPLNLCNAEAFRQRTGGMSYLDLVDLFTQQLSSDELRDGAAATFYINATGEGLGHLEVAAADALKGNVDAQIAGLSPKRLDRLSRFIRLSRASGIAPTALDWLYQLSGEQEITPAFLRFLAEAGQLAKRLDWSVEQVAALAGPFKTTGRGDGIAPGDPFSQAFNPPALLGGRSPSLSANPIPFDLARPLAWWPDARWLDGSTVAAGAGSITLDAGASARDGEYDGLEVLLMDGAARGGSRIVKRYEGATRCATLYSDWEVVPATGARYRVQSAAGLTDRLAAALQVRQTELATLGLACQRDNAPGAPSLLLTLETLTNLWRLGAMAWQQRMTVDAYLLSRHLLGLDCRYQAGAAALRDAQLVLDGLAWQESFGLSPYELDYAIHGQRSRYVQPAFNPAEVPAILADLAASSQGTRLGVQALQQAGFDADCSTDLLAGLRRLGVVDALGLMAASVPGFDAAAAAFPITAAGLQLAAGLDAKEARATLETLATLTPPVLRIVVAEDTWAITENYPLAGSLDALLQQVPQAEVKREAVGRYLASQAARSRFQMLSPLLALKADAAFSGPGIGAPQSRAIFARLAQHALGVIVAESAQLGYLSAGWGGGTGDWALFDSPAAGQARAVQSYDPTTLTLRVTAAWKVAPDAFSYFMIVQPANAGQARSATTTSLTLAEDASSADGAYVGCTLALTAGAAVGETRTIVAYDGASRSATVAAPWDTAPAAGAAYLVGVVLLQGNADSGDSDSIVLPPVAAPDAAAYAACQVLLTADPNAAARTAQVRMALDTLRGHVVLLEQTVDGVAAQQQAAALGGIAAVLSTSVAAIAPALPFASAACRLPRFLVAPLLSGDGTAQRAAAAEVLDGLSRFALVQGRVGLSGAAWTALARQPARFGVSATAALRYVDLQRLAAWQSFNRAVGDDGTGLARYLALWPTVLAPEQPLETLQQLTGWQPRQVREADRYLSAHLEHYAGLTQLDGVLRLVPVLALAAGMAADVAFLTRMADVTMAPPLAVSGGVADPGAWQSLVDAADGALAAVAGRFGASGFDAVADQLRRDTDSRKRDALLDYLVWHLKDPAITGPSDLFQYLLIDVEASCCDTTTQIAQAIPSVQLYMQRCRMRLEPGATVDHIPVVWWQWMTRYRVWEANRRIFLYPENYLVASQRKLATPQFESMQQQLLQARPTEPAVARALTQYFNDFESLTKLVPVGAYKAGQADLAGGQVDETLLLAARTNTSPYKYYLRTCTRSLLPESRERPQTMITQWQPWQSVGASIDAAFVTPVWAFERPFLFWNEIKPTKSSTIASTDADRPASATQSTWQTTLKYSFPSSANDWLAAQELMGATAIRVAPNLYPPASNPNVAAAYDHNQHYWKQPFALAIPRGLPGTGTLTFGAGATVASGTGTRLDKQIEPGDFIFTAGQKLQVDMVDGANQTLTVRQPFRMAATATPFNVILKDPQRLRYAPYQGVGTVAIMADFNIVDGTGTAFTIDFAPGDFIQVGNETRVISSVRSDTQLLTTKGWGISTEMAGDGDVTLYDGMTIVDGSGSHFIVQAFVGAELVAMTQRRTIVSIKSEKQLLIDRPFDIDDTVTTSYTLGVPGRYTVLPRAEGNERLMVFYGPGLNLETDYGLKIDPPVYHNPGDDPYLAALQQVNNGLYQSLNLLQIIKGKRDLPQKGEVTGQKALILNSALTSTDIRLYNPAYAPTVADSTPLTRLGIDRDNSQLFGSVSDHQMVSVYWGNSAPGTTANQGTTLPGDRPLLHHISPTSATLLGVGNQIGWYLFNNNSDSFLFTQVNEAPVPMADGTVLRSFWQPSASNDLLMESGPYSLRKTAFNQVKFRLTRLSTSVAQPLKQRLFLSIDRLLALDSQSLQETPLNQYFSTPSSPPPSLLDASLPPDTMDFSGANGLYFWEIFYHAPMLVAEWLSNSQDHENAKRWFEHVFNPTAGDDTDGSDSATRYWRFRPFREGMNLPSLKQVLTNTVETNLSNNDPFDPDAIARLRISAYAKAAVLKYVDNLIKWADAQFTADTRESISQATNLYVMARDLLGEPPQVTGVFRQPEKLTYNEIKAKYPDGIPQYLIDLENTPFLPATGQGTRFHDVPVNDIHAYFGVPDNEELRLLWDTIDDRLYKIRHCMNIHGVVRQLALFAPSIDPRSLAAGVGQPGSLAGGASELPYPIPNYRFSYLIQTARGMAEQVARFGNGLLAALERQDSEALSALGLSQQATLLQLTTEIKQQAIAQVQSQGLALVQGKLAAQARLEHYQRLIAQGMLGEEIAEMSLLASAAVTTGVSSVLGAAAAVAAAFPQVGSPFAMTFGGQQLGPALQNSSAWTAALARVMETTANILGIVANFKRQADDWDLQQKLAGFDVAQYQAQLVANEQQLAMAQRDLQIHQTSIAQNQAMQEFYQSKFTNRALFSWLAGRLATVHFQAYSLALEFARMAQRAYQFEYRVPTAFIAAGYWDDAHRGLLAGEALSQSLAQLEAAAVRNGRRLQEISKVVSLRQLDPAALLRLIRTGETDFELSERLFDQDFPGHYLRRIQSVRVSIPALVGPYQNIHATLTQTANRLVLAPNLSAVRFLLGDDVEVKAGLVEHNVRPYQRISLSQGQGDSGVFDPAPSNPLYLPFEQTGAVSSWHLSLPKTSNLIDFNGLSDVVVEINYTARDGGDSFRDQVAALPQLRQRDWHQLVQPALQYQDAWSRFLHGAVLEHQQRLQLPLQRLVPPQIDNADVLGVLLQLVVPPGCPLGAQHPYVTVQVGAAAPVTVLPQADGSALVMLDRPLRLKAATLPVAIGFDLQAGYTPPSLRVPEGDRLDPAVLQDINTVVFLTGRN